MQQVQVVALQDLLTSRRLASAIWHVWRTHANTPAVRLRLDEARQKIAAKLLEAEQLLDEERIEAEDLTKVCCCSCKM